ncbi:MAG: hypothetical protein RLZ17_563, partial [Actinomycetota bacterium]
VDPSWATFAKVETHCQVITTQLPLDLQATAAHQR